MDAFRADDECPFCFIEKNLEQHAMDFVLGSGASYMEDDVRAETDKLGFCHEHYKKMFDYGNRLGCGLILTTHFKKKNEELKQQIKMFSPGKASMLGHFKKAKLDADTPKTNIGTDVYKRQVLFLLQKSITFLILCIFPPFFSNVNSKIKIH